MALDIYEKRTSLGNFESNLSFLNAAGVLKKESKILEIGTGRGNLLNHYFRKGYDIQGIEINEKAIVESKKLYGSLPIKLNSGVSLEFEDAYFDVVISFDVFEHIKNSDKHLSEVYRILRPSGHYLLQTPNKWTNIIFETITWKSLKWREDHCSLHNYWEIKKRFSKHNFEVQFYKIPVVNEFFKMKIENYLGKHALIGLKIFNPDKLPIPLRTNFFIKALKID
jgi:cyclopropane fatty-acyl-phospholipid synthase-like methyltransferase